MSKPRRPLQARAALSEESSPERRLIGGLVSLESVVD